MFQQCRLKKRKKNFLPNIYKKTKNKINIQELNVTKNCALIFTSDVVFISCCNKAHFKNKKIPNIYKKN